MSLLHLVKKNAPAIYERYRAKRLIKIDDRLDQLRSMWKAADSDKERQNIKEQADALKAEKAQLSLDMLREKLDNAPNLFLPER